MKNVLFAGILGLLLIGAGCMGGGNREDRWALSFNLPEGWVAYAGGDQGFAGDPEGEITPQSPEIVLQSTDKAVRLIESEQTQSPAEYNGKEVEEGNVVFVRAFRLDERRIISDEAEDLGKGFFREKRCEEGESCTANGVHNYTYYYVNGESKYQFIITARGLGAEEAIEVIRSAKPVRAL